MTATKVLSPGQGPNSHSLTSLPAEILRRIVELGSADTAQRLRGVCKLFRDICTDPLIYSAIIENGNGFAYLDFETSAPRHEVLAGPASDHMQISHSISYAGLFDTKWYRRVSSMPGFEIETVRRWALADFRARQRLMEGEEKLSEERPESGPELRVWDTEETEQQRRFVDNMPDWIAWLPELLLTGNPAAAVICNRSEALSEGAFTQLFLEAQGSRDLDKQWKTCLLRACYGVPSQTLPQAGKDVDYGACRILLNSGTDQQQLISADLAGHSIFYAALQEGSWAHHAHAVLALGLLRQRTLDAALGNHVTDRAKLPPVLYHIPQHTRVPMTPPFAPTGTTHLGTAHLETMLSPAFLGDGEWRGYYDYSLASRRSRMRFDDIMTGIKFRVAVSPADKGRLELEARGGRDQHGRFAVLGTADRKSGVLRMAKQYEMGTGWDWTAVMTPFGIVGCWGGHGWGGWFWLWKSAWVA